jgi:cell division protein FtsA
MDSSPIVALEIGTSHVRAVVAQARDDDHLMIIGLGQCASRGVRKGEIFDLENALSCVRMALNDAEENSNVAIRQVFLLVSGGHIQTTVNRGSIPILNGTEITREDVQHVMDTAKAISLPSDREVLHTICQHYYVDDQRGLSNPVGLEGSKLAVDMLILHGLRNRLKNTVRVARSVPVDVQDVAFSGLCAGLAVLSPEEKENGVLVLDLGGGTTDYLAYAGGTIALAGSLAVGGDHLTNDVARGLRIGQQQAERVKEEHGNAMVDVSSRMQKVELPAEAGTVRRFVKIGDVHLITSMRIEEILDMVKAQIEKTDLIHHLGAGVVLTGGGSKLRRMGDLCEKVFGLPCRVGIPREVSGISTVTEGPEFAAAIGMLRYAVRTAQHETPAVKLSDLIKKLLRI